MEVIKKTSKLKLTEDISMNRVDLQNIKQQVKPRLQWTTLFIMKRTGGRKART
jgi:hypothetical protein